MEFMGGGNGKSLVMGSQNIEKTLNINGKNIHKDDKFLFSGVTSIRIHIP